MCNVCRRWSNNVVECAAWGCKNGETKGVRADATCCGLAYHECLAVALCILGNSGHSTHRADRRRSRGPSLKDNFIARQARPVLPNNVHQLVFQQSIYSYVFTSPNSVSQQVWHGKPQGLLRLALPSLCGGSRCCCCCCRKDGHGRDDACSPPSFSLARCGASTAAAADAADAFVEVKLPAVHTKKRLRQPQDSCSMPRIAM